MKGYGKLSRICLLVFAVSVMAPRLATAQLPDPGATALGMGDNHTALARGYTSTTWNPAGLGMPNGPRYSGGILALRGVGGLGPVGLGDFADFEGRVLPEEVRLRWLDRIVSEGGERGSAGADVTYLAAQVGRVGLQLATSANLAGTIGPGAAELLLFGNAGRSGEPVDLSLRASALDVTVTSTAALAYAHPILREDERSVAIGATLKYTVGHFMATAADVGSEVGADPVRIDLDFPVVQTDTTGGLGGRDRGEGFGLDVGISWRGADLLAGLVLRNLFNTFEWNEDRLLVRPGRAILADDTRETDFDLRPFSAAPNAMRDRVRDLRYPLVLAAGFGYQARPELMLSADVRQRLRGSSPFEPATHAGVGAEYRPVAWLPLRAGTAILSGGYLLSTGIGIQTGAFRIDAAFAHRRTDLGSGSIATFGASLQHR